MNQYVAIAGAAVWVLSLAWVYDAGKTAERSVWLDRESAELRSANGEIIELENKVKADHLAHSARIASVAEQYEKEKQREIEKRDRRIADLRSDNLRLRDPGSKNTADGKADGVTTGTSQCDGHTGSQLSVEASEFLLRLTGEADEVVVQLTACQAVVQSDRGMTATTEGEAK